MALLTRYDPPAFLPDFATIPGQLDAWHRAMTAWFDLIVAGVQSQINATPQYYNAVALDPGGVTVEQAVTWNAFPKELLRRYGRERALWLADQAWPIERYRAPSPDPTSMTGMSGVMYRPQEEYCEWHVTRDPDTGRIRRVTFTSEPPEYWQALFGVVPGDGESFPDMTFPGDRDLLLRHYREMVSPDVQPEDLIAAEDVTDAAGLTWVKKGEYNFYNKWNTTHGIVHLCSPPNSLVAEVQLGGDGTVLRTSADGRLLVEPDALIAYAGYGGPNRNSDPTIGAAVNALARLGAYVTLKNPVGLYVDHIDLSGWAAPDGGGAADFVRIARGSPGMIERLVVEAPPGRGLDVSDLTIADEPVHFGGQIAECVTVKLVGLANVLPAPVKRPPVPAQARAAIDPFDPRTVGRPRDAAQPLPPGTIEAFRGQGVLPAARVTAEAVAPPAARRSATARRAAGVREPHERHISRTR